MSEETAPITVADFLVPVEEKPIVSPIREEKQSGQEAPAEGESEDTLTEDEKLLSELDGEEEAPADEAEDLPPPPNSWSKDDAEAWRNMPPEAREVVMRREKERDTYVANKGREFADQRRTIETQAMEAVAQHAETYAAQLSALMEQVTVPAPDPRYLDMGEEGRVHYFKQDAAHRASLAQQQELQQRVVLSQQQAQQARSQVDVANQAAEAERLRAELPEFFDPEAGPTLQQSLESVGKALGYPPELMAQAGATDILALKTAAEWHDKATKYDRIIAKRMESVRGAKNLPKMTRPGAAPGQAITAEVSADRQAAAIAQFQRDRSGDAAAALLFTRKR